jgi:hypothetical protein
MYDGMVVTLQIPKNVYLVRISTRSYGNWIHVLSGMMIFKGRTMQESCIFCAFDMVCKLEMRYLFGAGLVPKSKLPFHILKIWIAHQ